jgi:hypothetical protein
LSGVVSWGGGDVGRAGQAEQADRGVGEGGHDLWGVAGADLRTVFVEDDVADPVGAVLDAPVALDPGREGGRWWAAVAGGGDHVDDLEGGLSLAGEGAGDLSDLGGASEGDPRRCGQDLDGAWESAGVSAVEAGVGRDIVPGQVFACGVRVWLVCLDFALMLNT